MKFTFKKMLIALAGLLLIAGPEAQAQRKDRVSGSLFAEAVAGTGFGVLIGDSVTNLPAALINPIAIPGAEEGIAVAVDLVGGVGTTNGVLQIALAVNVQGDTFTTPTKNEAERVKRITGDLASIASTRPQIDQKVWLPRAIADETVLADLRAMPEFVVGLAPLAIGRASDLGNPALEEYKKMTAGKARQAFRLQNHEILFETKRRMDPRAANTIATALVPDYLADAMIVVAANKLASLRAHSTDFGTDPMKPRAVVQVRKATTGSAAQTNPTNFETGDTTLAAVAVTVNQISKSFHVTNDELNKGHRLQHLAEENAILFADAVSDVVTALMIAANYGAATAIGAAASFDPADLPAIWALAKNYKKRNLILDGSHLAYLLPQDKWDFALGEAGAFGFDGIFMNNRWTSAVANIVGFVCSPEAIAAASGFPLETPDGEFLSKGQIDLPGLGLSVQSCTWFSRGGRINWASYDVMFGAAAGDVTQAENLVTA